MTTIKIIIASILSAAVAIGFSHHSIGQVQRENDSQWYNIGMVQCAVIVEEDGSAHFDANDRTRQICREGIAQVVNENKW